METPRTDGENNESKVSSTRLSDIEALQSRVERFLADHRYQRIWNQLAVATTDLAEAGRLARIDVFDADLGLQLEVETLLESVKRRLPVG